MPKILLTGSSGLIGSQLARSLIEKGFDVNHLSREKKNKKNWFQWNIDNDYIEDRAFKGIDYIIHLAGAGVVDKRWSSKRKQEILSSRENSARLLFKKVKQKNLRLKGFISASAVGYYGAITSDTIFTESNQASNDFLGTICEKWETASLLFNSINIRTVILRTGIVLSSSGGALAKLILPIKLMLGAPLGNGNQFIPWIHMEDLCNIYIKSIEDQNMHGIYNAVAPEHVNNQQFTKIIAKTIKKPLWLPNIPPFLLKIVLGEMSIPLLNGSRVSSEKIQKTGFIFRYKSFKSAINHLLL